MQFLAKSHYFTGTGFSGWISRTFFTAIGAVGVERGAGAQAQEALDQGSASSGRARRAATDEVMAAIHDLTGQELAGRYNETPPSGAIARLADRVAPRERV